RRRRAIDDDDDSAQRLPRPAQEKGTGREKDGLRPFFTRRKKRFLAYQLSGSGGSWDHLDPFCRVRNDETLNLVRRRFPLKEKARKRKRLAKDGPKTEPIGQ